MPQRPKYPLTPKAKEVAKTLVQAWDNGEIEQILEIYIQTGDGEEHWLMFRTDFEVPDKETLFELDKYNLISFISLDEEHARVLLLQELRNAVKNDFEVSDYFLTMNAVGTIVYGNLEVKEGALFQSVATNDGSIIQNTGQLVDRLEELLGNEVLSENPELLNAIVGLRTMPDDEPTRKQKLGLVVQELGRGLGHMSNTAGAIQAISLILKFFS